MRSLLSRLSSLRPLLCRAASAVATLFSRPHPAPPRRTPPRPHTDLLAFHPPGPGSPARAFGHRICRSAASLRTRARRRAVEQGRLRGGVPTRMAGMVRRRLPNRMRGTYGTSVVADVYEEHRAVKRRWWVARRAAVTALAVLGVFAGATLVSIRLPSPPPPYELSGNWAGVELVAQGQRPAEVDVSVVLPKPPPSLPPSGGPAEPTSLSYPYSRWTNAVWAGACGDSNLDSTTGNWLPQAGWSVVAESTSAWEVSPWAVVYHQVGALEQVPGWFGPWYKVPAGTRLTAHLRFEGGDRIDARVAVYAPGYTPLVLVRQLPHLVGEPLVCPGTEAVWEAVGSGRATPHLTRQDSGISRLLPTAPLTLTTYVRYADFGGAPSVVRLDLVGAGEGAPSDITDILSYRRSESTAVRVVSRLSNVATP